MAKNRGVMRVRFRLEENLLPRLKLLGVTMRSPQVVAIVQEGADLIAEEARRRAPQGATGNLRGGIYTASTLRSGFRPLSRRGGEKVNSPLRYPPRRGQVLVVSSTFYGLWVEKGRKPRSRYDVLQRGERAVTRTVGRQFGKRKRGKPFFRPAVRAKRGEAEGLIVRKLNALIERLVGNG